jgi:hypothetical protein
MGVSIAIYITGSNYIVARKSCGQQGDLRQMSSFKDVPDRAN